MKRGNYKYYGNKNNYYNKKYSYQNQQREYTNKRANDMYDQIIYMLY